MTNTSKPPRRMACEPKTEIILAAKNAKAAAAAMSEPEAEISVAKCPSKAETVLALLNHPEGVTPDELVAVNSCLPHTTRAAVRGLHKKGRQITRTQVDGVSRYAVAEIASW